MSHLAIILCVVCQFALVAGQVLLKRAVHAQHPRPRWIAIRYFMFGIAAFSIWFFLWVGLLQHLELSKIFPFESLNPALLVICAVVFLKERLPLAGWVGIGLLCIGLAVVAGS